MLISLEDIIKEVKSILDENAVDTTVFDSQDNINSVITSCVENGILSVHSSCDVFMLDSKECSNIPTINSDLTGTVKLPDDFMRLVSFKMKSWLTSVNSFVQEDSNEYKMQKDIYTRGTVDNPVCAIINGKEKIELFSCKDKDDEVESYLYVPIPKIDTTKKEVFISRMLKNAIIYRIAGFTLVSFGDPRSENFINISKTFM